MALCTKADNEAQVRARVNPAVSFGAGSHLAISQS
jgi:hypothetical protein